MLPEACGSPVHPGLLSPPCYLPQGLCAGCCPALGPLCASLESESLAPFSTSRSVFRATGVRGWRRGGRDAGRTGRQRALRARWTPAPRGRGPGVSGTLVGTGTQSWGPPPSSTPARSPGCTRPFPPLRLCQSPAAGPRAPVGSPLPPLLAGGVGAARAEHVARGPGSPPTPRHWRSPRCPGRGAGGGSGARGRARAGGARGRGRAGVGGRDVRAGGAPVQGRRAQAAPGAAAAGPRAGRAAALGGRQDGRAPRTARPRHSHRRPRPRARRAARGHGRHPGREYAPDPPPSAAGCQSVAGIRGPSPPSAPARSRIPASLSWDPPRREDPKSKPQLSLPLRRLSPNPDRTILSISSFHFHSSPHLHIP